MLVDIVRLAVAILTCLLKTEPDKLQINANLVFSLSFYQFFTLQTSDYDLHFDFCVDSTS